MGMMNLSHVIVGHIDSRNLNLGHVICIHGSKVYKRDNDQQI